MILSKKIGLSTKKKKLLFCILVPVFFKKSECYQLNKQRTYYNLTDIIHSANFSVLSIVFTV